MSQYKYLLAKEQEENSNNGKLYQSEFSIYLVNADSVKLTERSDLTHHYIVNTDNKEFAIVWTCTEKQTTNERKCVCMKIIEVAVLIWFFFCFRKLTGINERKSF